MLLVKCIGKRDRMMKTPKKKGNNSWPEDPPYDANKRPYLVIKLYINVSYSRERSVLQLLP